LGFDESYYEAAQKVLEFAINTGYDETNGGSYKRVYSSGKIDKEKGYWQQSECLRVLMHFMVLRGKSSLRSRYEQTLQYVNDEWFDSRNGGWFNTAKS